MDTKTKEDLFKQLEAEAIARDKVDAALKREQDYKAAELQEAETKIFTATTSTQRLELLANLLGKLVALKDKSEVEKYELFATLHTVQYASLMKFLQADVFSTIKFQPYELSVSCIGMEDMKVRAHTRHTIIDLRLAVAGSWKLPVEYVTICNRSYQELDNKDLLLKFHGQSLAINLTKPPHHILEELQLSLYSDLNQFLQGSVMAYMLCLKGHFQDRDYAFGPANNMFHALGHLWGYSYGRMATEEEAVEFLQNFGCDMKLDPLLQSCCIPDQLDELPVVPPRAVRDDRKGDWNFRTCVARGQGEKPPLPNNGLRTKSDSPHLLLTLQTVTSEGKSQPSKPGWLVWLVSKSDSVSALLCTCDSYYRDLEKDLYDVVLTADGVEVDSKTLLEELQNKTLVLSGKVKAC